MFQNREIFKDLFKVNNRNTRKQCEIRSKLMIKTAEWRRDIILIFLLLTLHIFHTFTVSIVDFEQVNVSWALFITQDKRRNKRNLLNCLNSTFKLHVTCKGIKYQVWKVWFVYYTFMQVFNNAEVYWNKRKKNMS